MSKAKEVKLITVPEPLFDRNLKQAIAFQKLDRLVGSGLMIWSVDWIPGVCCKRDGEQRRNYGNLADLVQHEKDYVDLPTAARSHA